ncbi:hypothetical protein [Achromobacter aloeverae]|uniref:Uncharacterized protein n=1 Tax=Achromobacter aloeverae TaxID=1750518 RepID=A0A4Q1HIY9_9BURK|nr:hypothetical protein [Achromobacter aloeverae]RXN88021.1 hypothetical protein C7R54_15710 [Achromobacter aloeverae]
MGIDATIPLGIRPAQSSGGIGSLLGTASDVVKLRAASQQLQANQSISQAYQQSIDPQTGQVDYDKFQQLAAQSGAGAFLPQYMNQVLQQRNQQQQYDTSKLEMALKQQGAIRGMIGSLMQSPNYGKADMSSDIVNAISDAVNSGILPKDQALRELKSVPQEPGQQAEWVKQHFLNSLSGEAKIGAMLPQGSVLNTGGSQTLLNRNPLTGESMVAGTVQNTPSADTMVGNVEVTNPDGSKSVITKAQQLGAQAGLGGAGYTGRYNPQQGGNPGLMTALPPGQQAALTAAAGTSNTAAQTLHDAAADAPMRINLLEQARSNLGNIDTGPGSDWRNTAKSFLNALSPDVAKKIGITEDIKDYDEFKKILTNYASSVSGAIGSGTDARLNAAVTGNANPGISKMANQDILTKTIAAEKMRAAQDLAFQNSGLTTDQFNKWQSNWNKTVNPDAFVFTSMTPDQQKAFIDRKTKDGTIGRFKSDLGNLVRSGILQMPGQ